MRTLGVVLAMSAATMPAVAAKPQPGIIKSGIWANSAKGCTVLKTREAKDGKLGNGFIREGGLVETDAAFFSHRRGTLTWVESSCDIGKRITKSRFRDYPLTCAGEGLNWTAKLRILSALKIRFIGEVPTSGQHQFCRR